MEVVAGHLQPMETPVIVARERHWLDPAEVERRLGAATDLSRNQQRVAVCSSGRAGSLSEPVYPGANG